MKQYNLLLFSIILFALLIACQPEQVATQLVTDPQVIFFTSDRNGDPASYSMSLDGKDVTAINLGEMPAGASVDRPIYSPTAGKYFFSAVFNNQGDVFSVNADGTGLVNLTDTPEYFDGSPFLSPDEKHIAFVSSQYGTDIMIMDTDGKNLLNLTNHNGQNDVIQWAPDSSRLFFSSNRATPNIYSINLDGTGLMNISKGIGLDGAYSVSPDGEKIAFDSDREGAMDIFVIDSNGGDATNLTQNPAIDVEPLWSPDGTKIAFRSDRDGNWNLFVMNADGSNPIDLTKQFNLNPTTISWLPDSQHLLFTSQVDNQSDIFILAIDGSPPINLTNDPSNDYGAIVINME